MARDDNAEPDAAEAAPPSAFRFIRANEPEAMRPASERGAVRADYQPHPATLEGVKRFGAGAGEGAMARILFSSDEMHVAYAWFKSGFPLPLHSHDVDCFYQIIAGSMRFGTEDLGKGDGVFIPAGTPYTATPGPEGVEFLEVRPTHDYDTRYRGRTEAYWDKIAATLSSRKEIWASEKPPFDLLGSAG